MTSTQQATLDRWEAERAQAMKDLGQRIKAHRLRRGMLQKDLAKAWRTKKESICAWETGQVLPTTRNLQRIALFVGDDDIADLDRYSTKTGWRTQELINAIMRQGTIRQEDIARYTGTNCAAVSRWRRPGRRVQRQRFLRLILLHEELTGKRHW